MKAYVITNDDEISNVLVDRKKARDFWVYEIWAYGTLNPEFHELKQALASFHEAEAEGYSSMYGDPKLYVKEVTA